MKFSFIAVPLAIVLTGCAVGPNYERPNVPAPVSFRAPEPLPADQARVVVPGDKRGGRYVRDVARIEFITPQPGH